MTEQGSQLPSFKLTATTIGTIAAAAIGRWLHDRYGWEISPALVDLIGLAIGVLIGYLVPELNPSRSAAQALRRQT